MTPSVGPMDDAVPAATVVLLRDGDDGLEVLMLRRASTIAFGGMWVFPGGRIDPGDLDEDGGELAAAGRAAVREAFEEAAVVVDPATLVPSAHWMPPPGAPRRFATWFFLAPAPPGAEVAVDDGEIREHAWLRPADALARRDAGTVELAPPTWVTLWRLAEVGDVATALAGARARQPERFETHIAAGSAGPVAVWHGDAAYPDGDLDRPGPRHRLSMLPGGWCYELSAVEAG
jgi:8-oxo-dGTP pyrophosphatase MutT (NUDIX family)